MYIENVFKEKGYILINVLVILMVISLIAAISVKVSFNNKLHKSLEYKKGDLYSFGNFEIILCSLNRYSKENKANIDEIMSKGIEKDLNNGMNLGYIREIDKFNLIYINKGFRYEKKLRYRCESWGIIFLPLEEKYSNKELIN